MKTPAQRYIEGQRGREILDDVIDHFDLLVSESDSSSMWYGKIANELQAIKRLMACCDPDEWCQCEKKNDE